MNQLRILVPASLALLTLSAHSAQPAQARTALAAGEPTREAKAAFLKKCWRDRTPMACNAPPQARRTTAAQ